MLVLSHRYASVCTRTTEWEISKTNSMCLAVAYKGLSRVVKMAAKSIVILTAPFCPRFYREDIFGLQLRRKVQQWSPSVACKTL